MLIDNYNFFRDKLEFTNSGDFYVISIILRKKDITIKSPNISKILLNNIDTHINPYWRVDPNLSNVIRKNIKNDRILYTYFIKSIEEYNSYEEEIKELCKLLQARVYFCIVKQNIYDTFDTIHDQLLCNSGKYEIYDSFIDMFTLYKQNKRNIYGLVDLDGDEVNYKDYIIKNILKWRFLYEIKSINGYHLIYNYHNKEISEKIHELFPYKIACVDITPKTILYYNDEKNS